MTTSIILDPKGWGDVLTFDAFEQVFKAYQISVIQNVRISVYSTDGTGPNGKYTNLHTPLLSASLICSDKWWSRALLIDVYQFMTSVIELSSGSARILSLCANVRPCVGGGGNLHINYLCICMLIAGTERIYLNSFRRLWNSVRFNKTS